MTVELKTINSRGIAALQHYLSGKVLSGVSSFLFFLIVTRSLELSEYATYVTAIAGVELAIGLSTFGLDWLAAVRIPQSAARGQKQVATYAANLLLIRGFAQTLLFLPLALITIFAFKDDASRNTIFLGLLYSFLEGTHRFIATSIFDPMMEQKLSKKLWISKSFAQLLMLTAVVVTSVSPLNANLVICLEILGTIVGLIFGTLALRLKFSWTICKSNISRRHLQSSLLLLRSEWVFVTSSYLGTVLTWVMSAPTFVLFARLLGGEGTAAIVGFCSTLISQIRRYLPTEMLIGVIRSVIYTRYTHHGDNKMLGRDLEKFLVMGVIVVLVCTMVFAAIGDYIIDFLTKGKLNFIETPIVLAVFGLAGVVIRRTVEMAANAVAASNVWMMATMVSTLSMPVIVLGYLEVPSVIWFVSGWILCDLATSTFLYHKLRNSFKLNTLRFATLVKLIGVGPFIFAALLLGNSMISFEFKILGLAILFGLAFLYTMATKLVSFKY